MKRLVIIALVIATCIGIMIASAPRAPRGTVQTEQQRLQKRQQRREQSRAVYRGLLNPHSEKIPAIAALAKQDVRIEREIGLPALNPNSNSAFNLQSFLNDRACDADAIVLGVVKEQTSRLTEDESFIYTISQLEVETVLKNNSDQPLRPDEQIRAIRSGGTIKLNGRNVVAVSKASKTLEPGQTYLLFLTFVPEKGLYVANNISYQIKDDKIVKLTEQQLQQELESGNDARAFISSLRAAIAATCDTSGGE